MKKELSTQLITAILSSPIVYISHFHYDLVDEMLFDILTPKQERPFLPLSIKDILEFDLSIGIVDFQTKKVDENFSNITWDGLCAYLLEEQFVEFRGKLIIFVKNADKLLCDQKTQSMLSIFAQKYERGCYDPLVTIILVSPLSIVDLPIGLEKIITIVDIKTPGEDEIKAYLKENKIEVSQQYKGTIEEERILKEYIRTLQGLQMYEMKQIVRSTTIRTGGCISEKTITLALDEKKKIVRKSGIIEVVDTNVSFDDIGGLNRLRSDLELKKVIYQNINLAIDCGISLPKGILIIGMPGCGKSMIAKSIASLFGVSLLRLDVNRLMGKYVGESEHNLRKALETAEAAHPCVLWIDEIEKAFAGTNASGTNGDTLVLRLMGHFLTWMQERKSAVYVVATANDVMRPEFMRKGRFDEVYFVNFPNANERVEILEKKLRKKCNKKSIFVFEDFSIDNNADLLEISNKMQAENKDDGGFSGAEIEAVVNAVFEKKFITHLQQQDKNSMKKDLKIAVTKQDFFDEIKLMEKSILCNQKSMVKEQKTNIDRIRELQKVYNLTSAI